MAERPLAPIERLFTNMKCAICGGPAGTCDCWTECRCGWAFEKGGKCRNPVHLDEETARQFSEMSAASIIDDMRRLYPEPMKYASGGFRRTLNAKIKRELCLCMLAWIEEDRKARDG